MPHFRDAGDDEDPAEHHAHDEDGRIDDLRVHRTDSAERGFLDFAHERALRRRDRVHVGLVGLDALLEAEDRLGDARREHGGIVAAFEHEQRAAVAVLVGDLAHEPPHLARERRIDAQVADRIAGDHVVARADDDQPRADALRERAQRARVDRR